jgi:type IV secretory pathway VirB2 component (pilin)
VGLPLRYSRCSELDSTCTLPRTFSSTISALGWRLRTYAITSSNLCAANISVETNPVESIRPSKRRPIFRWARSRPLTHLAVPLFRLSALTVYAQSTGSDPWDNSVNVLKTAFTGTIATGLSLVAIVVGGLMFAYGEGHSKKTIAGIVFGVGMAIGAVNFMAWLFPS